MFTIPFRIASPDAPLLVVQATVNGQGPFEFVLDTGNGAPVDLLVSPSVIRRLDRVATQGAIPFPTVGLGSLQLGDWQTDSIQAGVFEAMDQIGARIGVELSGNLASNHPPKRVAP